MIQMSGGGFPLVARTTRVIGRILAMVRLEIAQPFRNVWILIVILAAFALVMAWLLILFIAGFHEGPGPRPPRNSDPRRGR